MSIKIYNVGFNSVRIGSVNESSPLDLFASGEEGVWYDPSDLSTLYQDEAGTIAVTQDGDPVGLMMDKSGNNNHATQSVGSSKPVYRTDGTLHWIEGTTDFMNSPLFTLNENWFVSYVVSMNTYNNYHGVWRFLEEGGSVTSSTTSILEDYTRNTRDRVLTSRTGSLGDIYNATGALPSANTRYLAWAGYNPNATYHVGEEWDGNQNLVSIPNLVRGSGSGSLSLFRGYTGDIMPGKIYEFILSTGTQVPETSRISINSSLRNKHGITL